MNLLLKMNSKIRVLIAEDEFITLDMLKDYLEESGYELSGDAINAKEAIEILEKKETDIVLLDIHIKGEKDGIWLAEQIKEKYHLPYIFVSAYSDTSTIKRATNTNPYGYLVKPIKQADIFSAIEVALKNYSKEINPNNYKEKHDSENSILNSGKNIFVKDNLTYKKIVVDEIMFVQTFKNYLELHFKNERLVIRYTLQSFIKQLPSEQFIQVHRSYLINTKFITEVTPTSVNINGKIIPLSKAFKDSLLKKVT